MKIRIGTRKSPLALAQTALVELALRSRFAEIETETVTFSTAGDKVLDRPIDKIGGKGVFSGEIESALQRGDIDLAVHSAKDLPIRLGEGLEISGVLERGNFRDLLISRKGSGFERSDVFTVGTGSPRRRANLSRLYPNAVFADIRGNVDTRLKKLKNGEYDAVILCAAGTERLGIALDNYAVRAFEPCEFPPAPCQAIIALECAAGSAAAELARAVADNNTMCCFEAERAVIAAFGADCAAPVGAFAEIIDGKIHLLVSDETGAVTSGSAAVEDRLELVKELTAR